MKTNQLMTHKDCKKNYMRQYMMERRADENFRKKEKNWYKEASLIVKENKKQRTQNMI